MKSEDKVNKDRKIPLKDKKVKKLKCWEFFKCKEKECPAYMSKDLKCWLFSGTHCRDEIQGNFMDKIRMCFDCEPFKTNMDADSLEHTLKVLNKQYKEITVIIDDRNREIENASNEWRTTFDSMPYGVMLLDRYFKIIKTNQYISILAGIPIKELIGKNCYEIIYGINSPVETFLKKETDKTLPAESTEFYEPKTNKYFMLYSTSIPDEKGSVKAYVHSLIDVTESKEKEKIVIQSRDAFLNMLKDIDYSYKELKEMYNGLVFSFSHALDAKSPWTKGHSERVTKYSIKIAKEMGLKDNDIEALNIAGLLHDIGKIGTYDTILDKPAKLTDEEFALVKMHPAKGADILKPIRQLKHILPIIRHHHERIDGRGYPDGLKDKEIPFLARIIHVADSYDSMTADRPYRPAPGIEYAISELKKYSGTQFDPDVVEVFLKVIDNLKGEYEAS